MSVEQTTSVGLLAERRPGTIVEIAALAGPVVLQSLSETAMHVVDSAMLGRLGPTALAAAGFSGTWIWTLLVPFAGLAAGVQTFVSRQVGAKRRADCGGWVWQAFWLGMPTIVLWSALLACFLSPLLAAIGTEAELHRLAVEYGQARLLGAPAVVAEFALCAFFLGIGDTRTPLRAAVIGVLVNLLLAWLLIFGRCGLPALGVAGAGIAQSIGSYVMVAIMLHTFLRPPLRLRYATAPRRPDRAALERFFATSAPIGGQWLLDMLTFAVFSSIIARMGETAMAASQVMLQLLALSFMQAVAIGSAAGTLIGRYLGAGDMEAARRSHRSAVVLTLGFSLFVALLFLSVPEALLGLFTSDSEVLRLARPLLVLGAFFQVVDALANVAAGSLRGAGDTRWQFLLHACLAWLVRVPAVCLGALVLDGGVLGAWLGELAYATLLGVLLMRRFGACRFNAARNMLPDTRQKELSAAA
jgi:multidrug resistance protein, MATE family